MIFVKKTIENIVIVQKIDFDRFWNFRAVMMDFWCDIFVER